MGPRDAETAQEAPPGSRDPEEVPPGSRDPEEAPPGSREERQPFLVDITLLPPDTVTSSDHVNVNICQSASTEPTMREAVCCKGICVFQRAGRLLREHRKKAVLLAVGFLAVIIALILGLYFGLSSNKDGEKPNTTAFALLNTSSSSASNKDGELTTSAFPFLNTSSTLSGWETCGNNVSLWRSPGKASFNGSRDSCAQNNGRLFNDSDLQVLKTCYEILTDTWIHRMDTDKCSIYDGNDFYDLACDSERHFMCVREI